MKIPLTKGKIWYIIQYRTFVRDFSPIEIKHISYPLYNILIKISSENGKGVIIICKICNQYFCPPACPNFDGFVVGLGSSVAECEICSTRLYDGDVPFEKNGKFLCQDCASDLISQDLLDFLDCADIKDFFDMLL